MMSPAHEQADAQSGLAKFHLYAMPLSLLKGHLDDTLQEYVV